MDIEMYRHVGLTPEANLWLEENCIKEGYDPCPHCGKMTKDRLKVIAEELEDLYYGDGPTLHTYLTNNGKKVKEIIQAWPWNCGPMGYLCLELEDGTRICKWTIIDDEVYYEDKDDDMEI